MRIALIQQYAGFDVPENLERGLEALRAAASRGAELVAFAELAYEPFWPARRSWPRAPVGEPIPGPTTDLLCALARELGVVVVSNLYEAAPDGKRYDASPVIDADGSLLGVTRMLHITDFPGCHERDYYASGDRGVPVHDTAVGRVGVAICYDRHYPEVMRSLGLDGAQLVVVPQAGLVDEWDEGLFEGELRVAALQNGYFAALCNRVGRESGLEFAGESFVCGPTGRVLARAKRAEDDLLLCDVDLAEVEASPARRLFLRDRRDDWPMHR